MYSVCQTDCSEEMSDTFFIILVSQKFIRTAYVSQTALLVTSAFSKNSIFNAFYGIFVMVGDP